MTKYRVGDKCRNEECVNVLESRPKHTNRLKGAFGYCDPCYRRLFRYGDPRENPERKKHGRPSKAYDLYVRTKRVFPHDTARQLAIRCGVNIRTIVRYERKRRDEAEKAGR